MARGGPPSVPRIPPNHPYLRLPSTRRRSNYSLRLIMACSTFRKPSGRYLVCYASWNRRSTKAKIAFTQLPNSNEFPRLLQLRPGDRDYFMRYFNISCQWVGLFKTLLFPFGKREFVRWVIPPWSRVAQLSVGQLPFEQWCPVKNRFCLEWI
ncbi:hypothetical protein NE237_005203 [Protea cynaroides]|uniref:Uncharacterized protein n=1 Tax=Protea cynaroides TaxID=273540 RepID=A0A9Q0QUE3_9MAGN|nr:hypothetical protein NE237_005203 [Protea cynaroides]